VGDGPQQGANGRPAGLNPGTQETVRGISTFGYMMNMELLIDALKQAEPKPAN